MRRDAIPLAAVVAGRAVVAEDEILVGGENELVVGRSSQGLARGVRVVHVAIDAHTAQGRASLPGDDAKTKRIVACASSGLGRVGRVVLVGCLNDGSPGYANVRAIVQMGQLELH